MVEEKTSQNQQSRFERSDDYQFTTVSEIFESQAREHPDRVAVTSGCKKISYGNLIRKVSLMSDYLKSLNLPRNTLIAITLPKCIEMVIATMSILRAGHAFLPIDNEHPEVYVNFVLKNSQVNHVITIKQKLIPKGMDVNNIYIDQILDPSCKNNIVENGSAHSNSSDMAYVIYTSGSTNIPKGVVVQQKSLMNIVQAWKNHYQLDQYQHKHLQMASFSFDVCIGDIMRALCSGHELVFCPKETLLDPKALYTVIQEHNITFAEFVPSVLRKLCNFLMDNRLALKTIKILVCGSDTWSMGEYRRFRRVFNKTIQVYNSYGVTEATIDSCFINLTRCPYENLDDTCPVPIGNSFDNINIYLLDENNCLIEDQRVGEIFIGGNGLALGYINNSQLTKKTFIDLKIRNKIICAFKTGDLAYYLKDGSLVLVGRKDRQVNLNGNRVDLDAIRHHINQHPDIEESAVFIDKTKEVDKLIANVVSKKGECICAIEIRRFLLGQLPACMVPSKVIQTQDIQASANGKVLMKKVAALKTAREAMQSNSQKSIITRGLLNIWKQLLKSDTISLNDNFFELGGESLLLSNLKEQINELFGVSVCISELLKETTLQQQTHLVRIKIYKNGR